MTAGCTITEADAADIDSVMTVMNKAFDPRFGEAWTGAQCLGALALPGSLLLLARADALPVGFAMSRAIADEAELLLIAVRPDCQRRGMGESLVRHTIEQLSRQGVKALHLEVRTDNPALEFYRALGFERIGLRRNYYRRLDGQLTDAATLSLKIV